MDEVCFFCNATFYSSRLQNIKYIIKSRLNINYLKIMQSRVLKMFNSIPEIKTYVIHI